jgi:phage/plasmid-associated DNA primase
MSMDIKFFMLCNGIPLLDDCQEAEIRRLSIINFPTRFCQNPTRVNEKKIDTTVSSKLRECRNEFFNLLLEYLTKYLKITSTGNKIDKPKEVTEQLTKYIQKNKNDVDANEFIETFLEFDEDSRIMCSEVYTEFEEWCSREGKIKTIRKELDELIENYFDISMKTKIRFPTKTNYGWYSIRLKNIENEEIINTK